MATTAAAPRMYSADDLLNLPSDSRFELIRGCLFERSPASGIHGNATQRLGRHAGNYVEQHGLGLDFAAETGFLVARDPDIVLAPDWAFVSHGRAPDPLPKGFVPVVPDLVLETRSPRDTPKELALKVELWLRAGARMVWELDPESQLLTVHRPDTPPKRLGPEDEVSGEDVLPGFTFSLRKLFP